MHYTLYFMEEILYSFMCIQSFITGIHSFENKIQLLKALTPLPHSLCVIVLLGQHLKRLSNPCDVSCI